MQNSKGFSLIELILVTVLLSVIAGLTVPNFSSTYRKVVLKKSSEDLAFLMRYAQTRAILKSRPVKLEFNHDLTQYWLTQASAYDDNTDETETTYARFSGRMGRSFKIPENIFVNRTVDKVLFFPDGTIERARVYLCRESRNASDLCYTLSTQERRGHVEIYDQKVE